MKLTKFCTASKITPCLHTLLVRNSLTSSDILWKTTFNRFITINMLPPDSSSLTKYTDINKLFLTNMLIISLLHWMPHYILMSVTLAFRVKSLALLHPALVLMLTSLQYSNNFNLLLSLKTKSNAHGRAPTIALFQVQKMHWNAPTSFEIFKHFSSNLPPIPIKKGGGEKDGDRNGQERKVRKRWEDRRGKWTV